MLSPRPYCIFLTQSTTPRTAQNKVASLVRRRGRYTTLTALSLPSRINRSSSQSRGYELRHRLEIFGPRQQGMNDNAASASPKLSSSPPETFNHHHASLPTTPPLAHLAGSKPSPPSTSSTASASITNYTARHPVISPPKSTSSTSSESLRSLLVRSDSDLTRRLSMSITSRPPLYATIKRASSSRVPTTSSSETNDLEPYVIRDDRSGAESKSDTTALSWTNRWWPFSITGPESTATVPSKSATTTTSSDAGLLSYFAGKPAVTSIAERNESRKLSDSAENELLNIEPGELSRIAMSSTAGEEFGQRRDSSSLYREADEGTPIGSQTPASTSPEKYTNGFASILEGPSALFSSFSLPNPFGQQSRLYSTSSGEGKENVEPMLDDADQSAVDDSHMDAFNVLRERYECPKFPIVFCHGLFGFDVLGAGPLQISYWIGVKEALEGIGCETMIGRVPASASIEERAKVLCGLIEDRFPGKEVNLIGHSMGGLDGRFLISHLKPTSFKVRSLTTISTPHRGSSFADYMLDDIVGQQHMPKLLTLMETIGIPGGGRAFDNLTVKNMAKFNDETPDSKEVSYYSYGAQFEPSWSNVFKIPWNIIKEREGDNDGLVSVKSAKWGHYQATLVNVNHLDLVGWTGKVRYAYAAWLEKPIKFKPVSFFCEVAEMLAKEGH